MTRPGIHRRIRSFVRREGRITPAQQRALDELFPRFGIASGDNEIDLDKAFGRSAPRVLEIGFGNGEALIQMAKAQPDSNYIGIEVHRPGIGRVLNRIEDEELTNIRVMNDDAVDIIKKQIPDDSLDRVLLFFPDPWHKKKHHKRRILNDEFAQLVRKKLKVGGVWHMATDWQDYAEHMMNVMTDADGFENTAGKEHFTPRPDYRPLTKFEQRGQRLGHGVWDLVFKRIA
jgi:tRNA (guanine-N7-)-methyltransferase